MIRLLALDLDDTLVNSQRMISQTNKEAVQEARKKGVIVTFATGRAYQVTRPVCEELALDEIPVVTFGGAKIVQYPQDKILHQELLTPAMVREVLDFARKNGVYAQVYDGDLFCYNEETEEARYYTQRLGYPGKRIDLSAAPLDNSAKVLLVTQPEELPELYARAVKEMGERFHVVPSTSRFLEFYRPGTDKGSALAWLGEYFGVAPGEMLAMGDTGIDAPMLRYAGLGVAVANATEEAKAAADLITVSADDDAVACVIEEYVL